MISTAGLSARANDGFPHLKQTSNTFLENAHEAMQDPEKTQVRDLMALFTPIMRDAAMDSIGHFDE